MNFHASALVLGDRGLIIAGPSGSGKTTLCMALLDHCNARRTFARLVADDQIFLSQAGNRLVAQAPAQIAGKIEVRGLKPSALRYQPKMIVDQMVRLLPTGEVPRYGEQQTEMLAGQPIPMLHLAAKNTLANTHVMLAWFNLPPFEATQAPDFAV